MEIYILRHGDAQPRRDDLPEAERKLTSKGTRDVQLVVRFARACAVAPDLVLTSPYRRALETARIALALLESKPALETIDDLLPDKRPEQVWNVLRSYSRHKEILLVGHEPQLSHIIAFLLAVPSVRLDLKKGGLVRVRMDTMPARPHGELKWVITPAIARAATGMRTAESK